MLFTHPNGSQVITSIIACVGLIGNACVVISLAGVKEIRRKTLNILIINQVRKY